MTGAWAFADALYARPEVAAACLKLQDDHGQSVALLLWRLWTLDEGRPIGPAQLAACVEAARVWEDAATGPLRRIRRRLGARISPVSNVARLGLREQVAALELAAERIALETFEALTPESTGVETAPLPALEALARAWNGDARKGALRRLIELAAKARSDKFGRHG